METLIAEALAKIKPTDRLRVAKQAARRNRNCSDSSAVHWPDAFDARARKAGG